MRSHIFTDRPWLAADPTLGPWPDPADQAVFQTGAWILTDGRPLSPEVEAFLDAGEPPVYYWAQRIHHLPAAVRTDGAQVAARRLITARPQSSF